MKNSELKQWLIDDSADDHSPSRFCLSRIYELELALQRMVKSASEFQETAKTVNSTCGLWKTWWELEETKKSAESVLNAE